jgi:hypothetical protein
MAKAYQDMMDVLTKTAETDSANRLESGTTPLINDDTIEES